MVLSISLLKIRVLQRVCRRNSSAANFRLCNSILQHEPRIELHSGRFSLARDSWLFMRPEGSSVNSVFFEERRKF